MSAARKKLAVGVLVSGRGSNLEAILKAIAADRLDARINLVVSDRDDIPALDIAKRHGRTVAVIARGHYATQEAFERAIADQLMAARVELVCLAGFMRLIGPTLLNAFPNRIINIHPSLLPAFPGLHAQRQALEYGAKVAGCTVHFVDEACDHGPIILQAAVPVLEGDAEETLAERILEREHAIYPEAIQLFAEGRLVVKGRCVYIRGAHKENRK